MNRSAAVFSGLVVFMALGACPAPAAVVKGLDLRLGLEVEYDNNIYEYSDADLDAFDPAAVKFQGLESTDDWIVAPSATVEYRLPFEYATRFSLEAKPKFYQRNTVKDYQVYTARVHQELPGGWGASAQYVMVPSYFLHRLAEPPNQGTTYADAEFGIDTIKLSLQKEIGGWFTGIAIGTWGKKDYNAAFDERDTTIAGAGLELAFRPWKAFRVALKGEYEWGRAAGWDDPAFNSDVSYDQWSVGVEPSLRLARWLTISAGYTHENKKYITELVHDDNHYQREDTTGIVDAMLRFRIGGGWSARAGFEMTDRNSNRNGATLDFGSYNENRWLAAVTYEF